MNKEEAHVRNCIRYWVWSGFYEAPSVKRMIEDVVERIDKRDMYPVVAREFVRKAVAEQKWPDITDSDRLDAAFLALHAEGICALQNTGYEMSDGWASLPNRITTVLENTMVTVSSMVRIWRPPSTATV